MAAGTPTPWTPNVGGWIETRTVANDDVYVGGEFEPIVGQTRMRPVVEIRPYHANEKDPLTVLKGSVLKYRDPTRPVGENDWEAANE